MKVSRHRKRCSDCRCSGARSDAFEKFLAERNAFESQCVKRSVHRSGHEMTADTASRIRELRERAEELRDAAIAMKYFETRADLIAVAGSYDRLADELSALHQSAAAAAP
jgi:hypothetical protein